MEPLKIAFFPDGDSGPVNDFLAALDVERPEARLKLAFDLEVLRFHGPRASPISVRPMGDGLWELKRRYDGVQYRIFFCVDQGRVWLLHAIEKKSAKTSWSDLDLARRRMREVIK
jgi:phage-related protein